MSYHDDGILMAVGPSISDTEMSCIRDNRGWIWTRITFCFEDKMDLETGISTEYVLQSVELLKLT